MKRYGDGAGTSLLIISDFPCSYKYSFAFLYTIYEQNEIYLTKYYTKRLMNHRNSNEALGKTLVETKEIYILWDLCQDSFLFRTLLVCFSSRHRAKCEIEISRKQSSRSSPAHRFSRLFVVVSDRSGVMPRESKSHSASPKDTPISASPRVRDERNITKRLSIFSFEVGILLPGEE